MMKPKVVSLVIMDITLVATVLQKVEYMTAQTLTTKKHGDDDEFVETKMADEENYIEGAADDLNTTETVTVCQKDNTPHLTLSTIYNMLTTSFQPLAEDISKCPQLANMLHGFIVKAQQLLCDANMSK